MEGYFKNEHLQRAFQLRKLGIIDLALAELERGCEEDNDGFCLYAMGHALRFGGFGLKRNTFAAKTFFRRSALAGCPLGILDHASNLVMAYGQEQASWYEKAFCSEDAYARCYCYAYGLVVEQDRELARQYFLQACKEGNIFAMVCSSQFDFLSKEESFSWMEKAAQNGDGQAQYKVGHFLANGIGVTKNEAEAFEWYRKAASQQNHDCFSELARCYEEGIGCVQDFRKCAFYFVKSDSSYNVHKRLVANYESENIRLQELYIYGRAIERGKILRSGDLKGHISSNPIRIYNESCNAARSAALCFVWICKQYGWLNRDLRRFIGESVWNCREDPAVWGVSIKK